MLVSRLKFCQLYRLKLWKAVCHSIVFLSVSACSGSADMLGHLSFESQGVQTQDKLVVSPVTRDTEDAQPSPEKIDDKNEDPEQKLISDPDQDDLPEIPEDQFSRPGMIMGSFLVNCVKDKTLKRLLCELSGRTASDELILDRIQVATSSGGGIQRDRITVDRNESGIVMVIDITGIDPMSHLELHLTDPKLGESVAVTIELDKVPVQDPVNTAPVLLTVEAAFPSNGKNWNDFVAGSPEASEKASDIPCIADASPAPDSCLNAGEVRAVSFNHSSDCRSLNLSDELNLFDWICFKSGELVTFYSKMKKTSALADLTGDTTFQKNRVILYDEGRVTGESEWEIWWENPVKTLVHNNPLLEIRLPLAGDADNTIYVVRENLSAGGIEIFRSGVSLVVVQGASVSFTPGAPFNCQGERAESSNPDSRCTLYADSEDFFWVEGRFNASGFAEFGLNFYDSRFVTLHQVVVEGAEREGLLLNRSGSFSISGMTLMNGDSCRFVDSDSNQIDHMTLDGVEDGTGIKLESSNDNHFYEISMINSVLGEGVQITGESSVNNSFSQVNLSSGPLFGIRVDEGAGFNTFSNVSMTGVSVPVLLNGGDSNIFHNMALTGGSQGIIVQNFSHRNMFQHLAVSNFSDSAVVLSSGDDNEIGGKIMLGSNRNRCTLSGTGSPRISLFCAGIPDPEFYHISEIRTSEDLRKPHGEFRTDSECSAGVYPTAHDHSENAFLLNFTELPGHRENNRDGLCQTGEVCLFLGMTGYLAADEYQEIAECPYQQSLSASPSLTFRVFGK